MKTIKLTTCNSIQEANIIKGHLANEGIYSIITNENFTNLMPHYNGVMGAGVQILINESDYAQACNLIQQDRNSNSEIIYPFCNSKNVRFGLGSKKTHKIVQIILSLIMAIPLGNIKNTYYCIDCHSDFKNKN